MGEKELFHIEYSQGINATVGGLNKSLPPEFRTGTEQEERWVFN